MAYPMDTPLVESGGRHGHRHHHHHRERRHRTRPDGTEWERVDAVYPLILGIVGFFFWPLCWFGLHRARRLRCKVNDRHHPDYPMVTAAYVVNMVALIYGIVSLILAGIFIAVYYSILINILNNGHARAVLAQQVQQQVQHAARAYIPINSIKWV